MRKFGLLGRNISYSFSKTYFGSKFEREQIDATYQNFDLQDLGQFPQILEAHPELKGLNVTIPYKEDIIPFLDSLDPIAEEIGAVNTIKVLESGKLKGFNTDYYGFSESLRPLLKPQHKKALILGTGGASKAVYYALRNLNIDPAFVSRKKDRGFSYEELNSDILDEHLIIVNCTPLGTSPHTEDFPPVPIENITEEHLVYDLIYNPAITKLMELALQKGAQATNGLRMLELQAEKSWEHWN